MLIATFACRNISGKLRNYLLMGIVTKEISKRGNVFFSINFFSVLTEFSFARFVPIPCNFKINACNKLYPHNL